MIKIPEFNKDLFESNKSIILLIDPNNGNIINANKNAVEFYGYSKAKLLTMTALDINTISDDLLIELIDEVKNNKKNYLNFVHKLANGELRNVRVTSSHTRYLNTTILFSIIIDTTDEYRIKKELLIKEEKFKSFFELAINLQVITSIDGNIIQINNASKTILGYEENELIGISFLELVYPQDRDKTINEMKKLSNGENVYFFENRYIHKDGSIVTLIWSATSDSDNKLIYATAQNVTNIRLIEKEKEEKDKLLIQQAKMATMGEMIANIAHQLKQPLNLISISNSLLKLNQECSGFSSKEDIEEAINNVDDAVSHLSTTIDDFRFFFNPKKEKSKFIFSSVYNKTKRLISSEFKNNNIELITNIEDSLIIGYPNEIVQVLINVIKNAKDELVKDSTEKRRLIFIDKYKEDDSIFIKIKDNAGGIPEDIINDIFKSHFTTKKATEGTGIGLYMSKQIVEGMNGIIKAINIDYKYEDIDCKGALFTIELKQ